LRKIAAFSRPSWYNDISDWDTSARSTRIGIGIGRHVYSNTGIGSYRCVPVSSVLYLKIWLLLLLLLQFVAAFLPSEMHICVDNIINIHLQIISRLTLDCWSKSRGEVPRGEHYVTKKLRLLLVVIGLYICSSLCAHLANIYPVGTWIYAIYTVIFSLSTKWKLTVWPFYFNIDIRKSSSVADLNWLVYKCGKFFLHIPVLGLHFWSTCCTLFAVSK